MISNSNLENWAGGNTRWFILDSNNLPQLAPWCCNLFELQNTENCYLRIANAFGDPFVYIPVSSFKVLSESSDFNFIAC